MQAYLNGNELLVQTTDGIYTADFATGEFKAPDIELPYGSQPIFLPEYKLGSLNNGVISGWRPDETGNITETEIAIYTTQRFRAVSTRLSPYRRMSSTPRFTTASMGATACGGSSA